MKVFVRCAKSIPALSGSWPDYQRRLGEWGLPLKRDGRFLVPACLRNKTATVGFLRIWKKWEMSILVNKKKEEDFVLQLQVILCIDNIALQDWNWLKIMFNGMMMTGARCCSQISLGFSSLGQINYGECGEDLGKDKLSFVLFSIW